jgi:hypothetical protein
MFIPHREASNFTVERLRKGELPKAHTVHSVALGELRCRTNPPEGMEFSRLVDKVAQSNSRRKFSL